MTFLRVANRSVLLTDLWIFFIFDRMVLLNTFLSKTIKNNYIFSSKNANYATLEDKLNVFLSDPVNTGLPNICLLFFFFHIQLIPNSFNITIYSSQSHSILFSSIFLAKITISNWKISVLINKQ
jgi:hypothetical protein